jgi:phage terminase large subunit-like protein
MEKISAYPLLIARQGDALKLVQKIIDLEPDAGTMGYALKMRERLRMPMSVVLDNLWPDLPVTEKVQRLGITRQCYYGWLNGLFRPDKKMSKVLSRHTGIDADEIRGKWLMKQREA